MVYTALIMEEKLITLRKKYQRLAKKLGAPEAFHKFYESAQHDGNPHVEYEGNEFIYVVTERGMRYKERRSTNQNEILYWLVADVTWAMASSYELRNRIAGQDFRRQLFAKDIELMENIDPAWGQRKRDHYARILENNPYDDEESEDR